MRVVRVLVRTRRSVVVTSEHRVWHVKERRARHPSSPLRGRAASHHRRAAALARAPTRKPAPSEIITRPTCSSSSARSASRARCSRGEAPPRRKTTGRSVGDGVACHECPPFTIPRIVEVAVVRDCCCNIASRSLSHCCCGVAHAPRSSPRHHARESRSIAPPFDVRDQLGAAGPHLLAGARPRRALPPVRATSQAARRGERASNLPRAARLLLFCFFVFPRARARLGARGVVALQAGSADVQKCTRPRIRPGLYHDDPNEPFVICHPPPFGPPWSSPLSTRSTSTRRGATST